MKLHKSCRTLPIYNFYKVGFFKDHRFLIKGYNEYDDADTYKAYKSAKELIKIYDEISREYTVLIQDNKSLKMKKLEYELIFLAGQYGLIIKVLKLYNDTKVVAVLDLLNGLDVKFNDDMPIAEQLDKAIQKAKTLKNKINIKNINYKKLSGVIDDAKKEDPEDIIRGLDKDALSLEVSLELGYQLDVKKITVERWVSLNNLAKERYARLKAK